MEIDNPQFILDNTAVSNFSSAGRMDILRSRYGGRLIVTREVLMEAENSPYPEAIQRAVDDGWIKVQPLYADSWEYGIFTELRDRGFGMGEAASIAVCSTGGMWIFISDDLDARREALRRRFGVVGTYGILAREVVEGKMGLREGNELLRRMVENGFRSHSHDLREEVERLSYSSE